MRCEQCDAICEWKGDHACDGDYDPDKWVFLRQYECPKCGCELIVYYPKEEPCENML